VSRFFHQQKDKRQLEEAVRRRIRGEPAPATADASSTGDLAESIRVLALELRRGGIEVRSIKANARGITVIGIGATGSMERCYAIGELERLIDSHPTGASE
jgi:hypothetical protein